MTLLAEKLKAAGAQTAESCLMVLACEALRESRGDASAAADKLWRKLQDDYWAAKEVFLLPYLRERLRDMQGKAAHAFEKAMPRPAPQAPKRSPAERKAGVEKIITKAVQAIKFGHMTSDGRDWASVGAHELDGMVRDGVLAQAIKNKLGVLSNSQRFKTIGELMNAESFERARGEAA